MKKMSLIANTGCILIMLLLVIPFLLLGMEYIPDNAIWMVVGGILGGLSLLSHELDDLRKYGKCKPKRHRYLSYQCRIGISCTDSGLFLRLKKRPGRPSRGLFLRRSHHSKGLS